MPLGEGRAPDPEGAPPRARRWPGALAIVVACLVVYAPALGAGFVFDDDLHLLENPIFAPGGLIDAWLNPPRDLNYWPVTWTSYWLEHQLWGFDPVGYHVVNVLVHAASALLVWGLLLRLGVPCAWLAAFLFAIHPVNVASVAWIAQRKNVLALFFFALSWLLYLRFEERRGPGGYLGALAAHAAATLSKPAAAPLPAVLLLGAWWRRGRIRPRDLLQVAPFLAVTVLVGLVEVQSQGFVIGEEAVRDDGPAERLAAAGWVAWFYLYKGLVPLGLSFVYPRWEIDPGALSSWIPLLAAVALLAVAFRTRRGSGRPVLFAMLYFGLALSPVLGFLDIAYMRFSYVADQYQYLALPGVVALVVPGVAALLARSGVPVPARVGVAAVAALLLAVATVHHGRIFHDSETLWRDTLAKNPQAFVAHYSLGRILQLDGRLEEAAHHYREALVLEPDDAAATGNYGAVLQRLGRREEALQLHRRAVLLDPESPEAHNNLAGLLHETGAHREALVHYRYAAQIDPEAAAVHYNMALLLEELGRRDEAIAHYRRCLELAPDLQQARIRLERALAARAAAR